MAIVQIDNSFCRVRLLRWNLYPKCTIISLPSLRTVYVRLVLLKLLWPTENVFGINIYTFLWLYSKKNTLTDTSKQRSPPNSRQHFDDRYLEVWLYILIILRYCGSGCLVMRTFIYSSIYYLLIYQPELNYSAQLSESTSQSRRYS